MTYPVCFRIRALATLFIVSMLNPISISSIAAQPKIATWQVQETWQIDGSEAGEPFADLRDFVALRNGHVWALDFKDQNIRRYDGNGKFLSVIAHKGSGPGEFANANGMVVAIDGSVWVNDPMNARISIFSADGKYLRQISRSTGGYGYRWDGWFDRRAGVLLERAIGGELPVWLRYDQQGKALSSVSYKSCSAATTAGDYIRAETPGQGATTSQYPFAGGGGLAPDGNGGIWCAAPTSTRIARLAVGTADTIARTTLEIPRVAVGAVERAAAVTRIEKMIARYKTNNFDKSKIPNSKPGVDALNVDDDGRLWVHHTSVFQQQASTLDVFDAKGTHLARVVLPARQNASLPVRAKGNLLWVAVIDEDDVPSIVQYRIRP